MSLREWALLIRRDALAVWLAARDPRVPWYAKLVAASVAAYAFSPIDLIPDFVPVFGYLDDAILIPLGVLLAARLIPPALLAEFRHQADQRAGRPISRTGAAVIGTIWLASLALTGWLLANYLD